MNLGDLEYKAEDGVENARGVLVISIERANQILREKLAKAKEVFGVRVTTGGMIFATLPESSAATHRARLVCIEEVGK